MTFVCHMWDVFLFVFPAYKQENKKTFFFYFKFVYKNLSAFQNFGNFDLKSNFDSVPLDVWIWRWSALRLTGLTEMYRYVFKDSLVILMGKCHSIFTTVGLTNHFLISFPSHLFNTRCFGHFSHSMTTENSCISWFGRQKSDDILISSENLLLK